MTDVEIARNTKLEKIVDIAKKIGIQEDDIEQYGRYKAKISDEVYKKVEEKLGQRIFPVGRAANQE